MSLAAPDTPPWRTRLALAAGVLAVHLWVLVDGWPGGSSEIGGLPGSAAPAVLAKAPAEAAQAPAQPAAAPAMTTTSVRWIAAAPPAVPQKATPRPPRPAPRTAEPAPVSPPKPASEPTPTPEVVQAPALHTPEPPPATPEPTLPPELAGLPRSPAPPAAETPSPSPSPEALAAAAGLTRVGPGDALPPGNTLLHYDVQAQSKGLSVNADAELRWDVQGDDYNARLEISAFLVGSRIQTSQGKVGPLGLVPNRFSDRRRRSENAAHFDQEGQRIRFSKNAPDATLLPGGQDRLSVFLQIGSLMRARPQAYGAGQAITLQVTGTGGADIWSFTVGPLEQLSLPTGPLGAIRLTRAPRREYDQKVELWLAPTLQYLPARIRITDQDGSVADQLLRELPALKP